MPPSEREHTDESEGRDSFEIFLGSLKTLIPYLEQFGKFSIQPDAEPPILRSQIKTNIPLYSSHLPHSSETMADAINTTFAMMVKLAGRSIVYLEFPSLVMNQNDVSASKVWDSAFKVMSAVVALHSESKNKGERQDPALALINLSNFGLGNIGETNYHSYFGSAIPREEREKFVELLQGNNVVSMFYGLGGTGVNSLRILLRNNGLSQDTRIVQRSNVDKTESETDAIITEIRAHYNDSSWQSG